MLDILFNNFMLLLVGQYPQGSIGGLVATLFLAITSILVAFPLSILIALGRISKHKVWYIPATFIVYTVRGLPLIMFIFWSYFVIPLFFGHAISGAVTLIAALVLYESAYMAEIIRSAIQSLAKGQMEAARSLGMSYTQSMRKIILPQALHNALPSLLSQFISTVKETSLGFVISVHELTFAASQINNQLLVKPFEVFCLLALTYFTLNLLLTGIFKFVEKRHSYSQLTS